MAKVNAKAKAEVKAKAVTPPVQVKAPASEDVVRKIGLDELISLQKEGRLLSYDPATGMGKVKKAGAVIDWPGGEATVS